MLPSFPVLARLQMDGFEPNEGIIVMGATNMQESLDPALTRPGRFDRHVAVPLPDVRGRLEILKYYLEVGWVFDFCALSSFAAGEHGWITACSSGVAQRLAEVLRGCP
jgi:ATP-dependent metalloprotease